MDNLNDNPLLDDDDEETTMPKSRGFGNPLLDDEDEESLGSSTDFALPELEYNYIPSGEVKFPKLLDPSGDDGSNLFSEISTPNANDSHASNVSFSDDGHGTVEEDSHSTAGYVDPNGDDEGEPEDAEIDSFISMNDSIEALERITLGIIDDDEDEDDEDDYPPRAKSSFELLDTEDDLDELGGFNLDAVISKAIESNASDIHINADDEVAFTILNDIYRMSEFGMLTPNITQRLQLEIISHVLESDFVQELELDTAYVVKTGKHAGRRLRLSVGKSFGNIFMVFRVISDRIPTPEELGITGTLLDWCQLPNGLVMMNGPTGTGKSTTLASLVRQIQLTRRQKIITIEKPIEYVYGTDGLGLVTQREVGKDSRTFAGALTSAMRQAPKIILIGEVRNKVEVNELLRAAETGHLAISTMHTNSAPATINRIKSLYEGDDQIRILGSLADVSRGFANQVLVKTPDGKGRFAIREVLEVNETVSSLILKGDVAGLQKYQMGEKITMDHELVRAAAGNFCTVAEARAQSAMPNRFDRILKEMG